MSVFAEGCSLFKEKKAPVTPCDPTEVAESSYWPEIAVRVLLSDKSVSTEQSEFSLEVMATQITVPVLM